MSDRVLIDTNLWVYLYAKEPQEKYLKIHRIFLDSINSLVISTQILGELYNVLIKKKFRSQQQSKQIISELIAGFDIIEVDTPKVLQAIDVNARYGYSYWDSLVIGTALLSACSILYSENMQHKQLIENKLRIINPFIEELEL